MITTLTMNPCVDHTVTLHGLQIGGTNPVENSRRDYCGKGVNVSVALHQMGVSTRILCLGHQDGVMEKALGEKEIPYTLIPAPGAVRTNLKLFDAEDRVMTECNEKGAPLSPDVVEAARRAVADSLRDSQLLAVSGSVPPGVPETFYREIAGLAQEAGVPVILDAKGAQLRYGVEAAPLLIKPNQDELRDAFGICFDTREEAACACRKLIDRYGIGYIALSMGAEGALLVSERGAWFTRGAEITVRGVQGAGDSMVAGFCAAFAQGETDGAALLRVAVAAANASLEKEGTQMCTRQEIEMLYPRVSVTPVVF